jgi:hypothetical protein
LLLLLLLLLLLYSQSLLLLLLGVWIFRVHSPPRALRPWFLLLLMIWWDIRSGHHHNLFQLALPCS